MKKRIAIHNSWLSPREVDFETHNSKIIINNSLICYTLANDDLIRMVLPHDIEEITSDDNFKNSYKEMMCQLINNLSERWWQKVVSKLNLK
ncbi:MAG: hypothetical protein ACK5Z5_02930 [Neisseriaceae bacterium]|jgi:hypothetical protein